MIPRSSISLSILALSSLAAPAAAQSVSYGLEPESAYVEGCYPPCLCPLVFADSLSGTFVLSFEGATPDNYDHYAVTELDWTLTFGGQVTSITGTGHYQVGGQVAVMQRLELDLSFDGAAPAHFDSGLVPGGAGFPRIEIAVSENGMVCFDRVFELVAEPRLVGSSYCASAPNSTGLAATIAATGSAVVAEDDFALIAQHAVPGQFGIFFFGAQSAQTPFGEGTLCVGGTLLRFLPPLQPGSNGALSRAIDFDAPPAAGRLVPGSGWNFQFWYRDPAGGPAGFNLTDGLHVDFL